MDNVDLLSRSIELYKSGKSLPVVCRETGIGSFRLYYNLKKQGLNRSQSQAATRYSVNHEFFSVIDSEAKAYWLGFFYADGYITKSGKYKYVGMSLGREDEHHLESFRSALNSTHPIKQYVNYSFDKEVLYSRLLFTSRHMYDDLVENGAVARKTLVLTFPSNEIVPDHLVHHFIRGYSDGDGSFAKSGDGYFQFKLCGTSEFLNEVSNRLGRPNPTLHRRRQDGKNTFYISVGGRKKVKAVGDYLYRDATIYLDRKYQRYLKLDRPEI